MEENQAPENEKDLSTKEVISSLKKRNWSSYIKEFFMLFLAVFCGFLAENYRGNMVEKRQEKQFIQSFIEDLKSDTATIRVALDFRKLKMTQMDSLMLLLRNQTIKGHENELYFFGRSLVRSVWFQNNDRTFAQLKNSGSLRLIRNEQATDSIMAYQKLIERLITNHEDDRTERYNAFPVLSQIFNPFVFDQMVTATGIQRPTDNPPLRSYDPALQQDLAFCIHQLKGSTFIIEDRLAQLNDKAIRLIDLLNKEYDLE
ncbi:hypothetical protein D0X99_00845 [Algoriphagus lacus]|uniref:Uncharacterized protein n=1 Tax=Algoriphagus lacus TaxID=2056311 RepID=A0A418PVT3_9BACT|nr:hypothetical protein [Algoriphagus lacus]RIW18278.1 hypothetical protein D0X99_00845 [Algoriphagus lacus]